MVKILQLSDSHVFLGKKEELYGFNTFNNLNKVINNIKQNINLSEIDLVLLAGDLIHDDNPKTYETVANIISNLQNPVYWLPGNHDIEEIFNKPFNNNFFNDSKYLEFSHWNIILLNSAIFGKLLGNLTKKELSFLENSLQKSKNKNVLVCLHHQPVDVGSFWLDAIGLYNKEAFWEIIEKYSNVKAILFGHIHQEFYSEKKSIKLFGTPSTSMQIKPKEENFVLDETLPGYRILTLNPNGNIETMIHRVSI